MTELVGFDDPDISNENEDSVPTKKNVSKKKGGFQGMGLSFPVLKGILKRGYKIPTPIQRKTIPVILEGRDVVAMARTGSGKTACFLIPLFEKLINSTGKPGVRALILSPTRELALQTLKFVKELGRFINIKPAVILGGDSIDNQFAALHGSPDIIVATPGRFLHVCVEMELKLQSVQFVVFDEADRLFEMGFGEQMKEIVRRLPDSRQTVLFSATLPKVLVEFAKAGLNEPVLIRLDVESKLPEKLDLDFLCCRSDEKCGTLLCILKYVIEPKSQTVVFAATRHHVEYLHLVLDNANIPNTYIYSNLDPSARKINSAKFQLGKVPVLLVTDIAARGLDIPQLDYVINFNFPAKPKLFLHRVGRCARAGRHGRAFSLVTNDELPYLFDLHLFLGRPLHIGEEENSLGSIPPQLLEEEQSQLLLWHNANIDLKNMRRVSSNAYKQYLRSRPGASIESVRRVKELDLSNIKIHKVFSIATQSSDESKAEILEQMKKYRPNGTVFEIGQASSSSVYAVMKKTRAKHCVSIAHHKKKMEDLENTQENEWLNRKLLVSSNAEEIQNTFSDVITSKRHNVDALYQRNKKKKVAVDQEHFIPYKPSDHHTEQGLSVNNFHTEAANLQLDLTGDTEEGFKQQKRQMKWDKKKKRMVGVNQDSKVGKIRTESGVWIPASFKTNRYAQWKEKNKIDQNDMSESDSEVDNAENKKTQKRKAFMNKKFPNTHWGRHNEKLQLKMKSELRRPEEILKMRKEKEKKQNRARRKRKRVHK